MGSGANVYSQTTWYINNTSNSPTPNLSLYTPITDTGGTAWGGQSNGIVYTGTGTIGIYVTNMYHGITVISNMGVVILGAAGSADH